MNAAKGFWYTVFTIVGIVVAFFILKKIFMAVLALLIPVAIVGAIGFGLYLMVGRKAIGSGRRRFLP